MASPELRLFRSFIPVLSGGLGFEIALSDDKASPWRLRAQCDALAHVLIRGRFVLFQPALEGVYSF
jgi:hypothetical protein